MIVWQRDETGIPDDDSIPGRTIGEWKVIPNRMIPAGEIWVAPDVWEEMKAAGKKP